MAGIIPHLVTNVDVIMGTSNIGIKTQHVQVTQLVCPLKNKVFA
jgi:hypothetical protein